MSSATAQTNYRLSENYAQPLLKNGQSVTGWYRTTFAVKIEKFPQLYGEILNRFMTKNNVKDPNRISAGRYFLPLLTSTVPAVATATQTQQQIKLIMQKIQHIQTRIDEKIYRLESLQKGLRMLEARRIAAGPEGFDGQMRVLERKFVKEKACAGETFQLGQYVNEILALFKLEPGLLAQDYHPNMVGWFRTHHPEIQFKKIYPSPADELQAMLDKFKYLKGSYWQYQAVDMLPKIAGFLKEHPELRSQANADPLLAKIFNDASYLRRYGLANIATVTRSENKVEKLFILHKNKIY